MPQIMIEEVYTQREASKMKKSMKIQYVEMKRVWFSLILSVHKEQEESRTLRETWVKGCGSDS